MADNIPIRDYFEARIIALEKATKLAADTLEKRLEGMNEFRTQLNRQASEFITKEQVRLLYDGDIRTLRETLAEAKGKASSATYISIAAIFVSIVIAIVEVLILILK